MFSPIFSSMNGTKLDLMKRASIQALDQFDRAVERGTVGRRAHVSARAELEAIADEVEGAARIGVVDDVERAIA